MKIRIKSKITIKNWEQAKSGSFEMNEAEMRRDPIIKSCRFAWIVLGFQTRRTPKVMVGRYRFLSTETDPRRF